MLVHEADLFAIGLLRQYATEAEIKTHSLPT